MSVERHISQTVILRILVTALLMVQSIFVVRILGPEGRGLFAKLQAAQSFFILFLGLGITSAVTYYVSNRKIETQKVMGVCFFVWLFGVVSLIVIQTGIRSFPSADLIFPEGFRRTFFEFYFLAMFTFNSVQLFFNAALNGRHRFVVTNGLEVVCAVARIVVFGGAFARAEWFANPPLLESVFALDLALTVGRTFFYTVAYVREFGWHVDFSIGGVWRPILSFSLVIFTSYLINFFYLRVDYWLIEENLGLRELGIYSTACGLAQFLTFIPITLNNVMLPHLAGASSEEALERFKLFSRINMNSLFIVAGTLIAGASPLIFILYGDQFAGAAWPLRIVTVSYVLMSLKHLFAFYNICQKRSAVNIRAELVGLAVGIVGNVVLLPRWGTLGASVASLAANLCSFGYVFAEIRSSRKVAAWEFFLMGLEDARRMWSAIPRLRTSEST